LCYLCRIIAKSHDFLFQTEDGKKMSPGTAARHRTNPKHFLTWSASTANTRIQKLSKHFVNNISKLHLKVEKAIPFQQGIMLSSSDQVCSSGCESVNGKIGVASIGGGNHHSLVVKTLNDHENNNTVTPDLVQTNHNGVSKECKSNSVMRTTSELSTAGESGGCEGKMIQQNGEIGNLPYHARVQSARIVQSHPSISHSHSQGGSGGSVANPDKIVQFSIDTYNKYAPKELKNNTCEVSIEKPHQVLVPKPFKGGDEEASSESSGIMELCYDSGTGSTNASLSDSSMSSVATLPLTSPLW
jgi:hypothetical protein